MTKSTIFIVASGTGGHIFPALAVADFLQQQYNIVWIGTGNKIEKKHVTYKLQQLPITGFRKKNILHKIIVIKNLFQALKKSNQLIKQYQPIKILSFGGYVSIPMGLMAKANNIPLIIHEQNAIPGLSNKILHFISLKTLTAYPQVLKSTKTHLVGNPLRKEFNPQFIKSNYSNQFSNTNLQHNNKDKINILIIGGSLGAKYFNNNLPTILQKIDHIASVIHQTGYNNNIREIEEKYHKLQPRFRFKVVNFLADIVAEYKNSDLIICRAGALTVTEITCIGRPAIFIPFPYAVDNHQFYNAKFLEQANLGFIVNQDKNINTNLTNILQHLSKNQCELIINNYNCRHNNLYCLNNIVKLVAG